MALLFLFTYILHNLGLGISVILITTTVYIFYWQLILAVMLLATVTRGEKKTNLLL